MSEQSAAEQRRKTARIAEARREKTRYERMREEREALYEENERKIERLRAVRDDLKRRKDALSDRQKNLKRYAKDDDFRKWAGDKHDRIIGELQDAMVPQYKNYIGRVDDVLDAVCDEMTRLQNKNMQLHGDVLRIGSLINSLVNEIRTLFN